MLIMELLKQPLNEDGFAGDFEIQNALEDIMVQLHHQGTKAVKLDDIAGELSKAVNSVQINPTDPDFKNILISTLKKNTWVDDVSSSGFVKLKDVTNNSDDEVGDDDKKDKDRQDKKLAKMGAKSLKKKSKEGDL